ncbi:MAG: TatD family hydrolase [Myxococcales bacterium]|nr:TatD family hydrolase [Myxococcales bacterium]
MPKPSPLRLADAHCHLDAGYFPEGAEAVMDRAHDAGVVGFVVVGVGPDLRSARDAVSLARRSPDRACACVGIHPHDASTWTERAHEELRAIASAPEVTAIGEIGLDYHYDHSPRGTQRDVFARLIGLARELRKPIVVHTRSAPSDTLELLEREGARDVGGVIHCFSENRAFAARALDLGFSLSFSGIVTFKAGKGTAGVQDVAAWAPLDRILVETDSPYLAPVPMRGKRCEPALVAHTARRVAELRGMHVEDLATATLRNTQRCFSKVFAGASRPEGEGAPSPPAP